ncbi:polyphosphate polymerase domain-containing protein [Berryella intestinalis]|uniref:polyphosphate polymerase domain-containing protein n=1 Tax=Berryella intestinalis TaxID=1531429 RepID=UPI00068C4109|nr:polyphosphate polymerase domain-containing protein [Berryella intestinalis]
MTGFIETFERKEIKYRLSPEQLIAVEGALAGRLALDGFGAARIESVYYDTPAWEVIGRSMEKLLYKEKLRVRTYGPYEQADEAFVELKKKLKGVVYKRRVRMSRRAAEAFLAGAGFERACGLYPRSAGADELRDTDVQIAREIEGMMGRWGNLRPALVTTCVRRAFAPTTREDAECGLRLTFDGQIGYRNLQASPYEARTRPRSARGLLLYPGEALLEVKCQGPLPRWLLELFDAERIYPSSFSKYGSAYEGIRSAQPFNPPAILPAYERMKSA